MGCLLQFCGFLLVMSNGGCHNGTQIALTLLGVFLVFNGPSIEKKLNEE